MAHSLPHNPPDHREHAARAAQGRAAPQHSVSFSPAENRTPAPQTHVNLDRCRLSLIKGEHRWRFRWERGSEAALISAVADLARNDDMDFDWFDAAVVCRHIAQAAHSNAQISPHTKCD
jgi:hypothetical protein